MKTVYMFDVDGTLTPARQRMKSSFRKFFLEWSKDKIYYLITGSDIKKTRGQVPEKILDNAQFLGMVSGLRQELSFSDLIKELISWGLTRPEENYNNFRNYTRYGKLSGYAHSEERTHDISRLKKYFGHFLGNFFIIIVSIKKSFKQFIFRWW